ncbi:MAG: nucleotide exchange factor GrpE [Candidatus Dasytiphilus stammeri]
MSSEEKEQPIEITNQDEQVLSKNENNEIIKKDHQNSAVDHRDERIAILEMQLIEAQKHERDQMLRAQAELKNIRRRADIEIEKIYKFSLEKFIGELLPVIDNLERALQLTNQSNQQLIPMIEGIKLTLKSLLDTMHKYGVKVIKETQIPFNPDIHQAMSIKEIEEQEEGIKTNLVLEIIQPGYMLNGRLLRPAMVSVSKKHNQQ